VSTADRVAQTAEHLLGSMEPRVQIPYQQQQQKQAKTNQKPKIWGEEG
jgi:hypothetical protein